MDVIAQIGQPERIHARRAADIEHGGRRRRNEALNQLLRTCFLQHEAAALMAHFFGGALVVVANTEFLAFPHGVSALKYTTLGVAFVQVVDLPAALEAAFLEQALRRQIGAVAGCEELLPTAGPFDFPQQQRPDALSVIRRADDEQLHECLSEEVIVEDGVASDVVAIERSQTAAMLDGLPHRLGSVGIRAQKRVDESQPRQIGSGGNPHLIDRSCVLSSHESQFANVRFVAF